MGIAADKIAPFVGRLGVFVGILTAISCAAFIALPFVAGTGPGAQVWFIVLIVIWVVTSSALRAPPLTLLGKHRARPACRCCRRWRCWVTAWPARCRPISARCCATMTRGAVRDLGRGAAAHHAGAVEGRARRCARKRLPRARPAVPPKPLGHDADVLHRLDGDAVAGLSTAFQPQQRAVLPAFREAGRSAMADAGVLDRLQHRDVSGQRRGQASRRVDRDGRGRPVGRVGGARRRARRAASTC